jgi:hypothetical protein
MNVKARKTSPGHYVVTVDGKDTELLIAKGEAPQYRMPQEWSVYVMRDGREIYLFSDARSLSQAIDTVRVIMAARP